MAIEPTLKSSALALARFLVTLAALAAAGVLVWRLWQHYEVEPWTRDGRVKADVVQVAPDVTGQVTKVLVHDNQQVESALRNLRRVHSVVRASRVIP